MKTAPTIAKLAKIASQPDADDADDADDLGTTAGEHLTETLGEVLARLSAVQAALKTFRPSGPDPLTVDKKALAALLTCSTKHLDRMVSAGELMKPIRLGDSVKLVWRLADIREWVGLGCPAADVFERIRSKK